MVSNISNTNISITGSSLPDCLVSKTGHLLRVLSLFWDAVGVFYSPSQLICYLGESKVLQYCGIVKHKSTTINAFAEILKVSNHTKL